MFWYFLFSSPKLFHNVHKLKIVKLKGNFLQEIDGRQFSKSSRLTHLDISNNELQRIAKSAFKKLYDIEILDLSHNQIYFDDVTKPDLSAMKNLKEFTQAFSTAACYYQAKNLSI